MNDEIPECSIRFVSMDSLEHEQKFNGSNAELNKQLIYLEEHGAHCISTDLDD